jgi:WD40 repeat protein/serine/threonine protein kinase/ribosomal protein S27AE
VTDSLIPKADAQKCGKCGAPLARESRRGFCGRCYFAEMLAMSADPTSKVTATEGIDESLLENGNPGAANQAARRIGDYELHEELGRGGMGIVYRARQLSIRREVAVKLLHFGPMAGDETVKRLRMEATAAGCLRHPNIVAIHEVGIHQDQHYLVMDYVAGPNLANLAAHQPWPSARAARLVQTVAEAIQHAHDQGILHRDLKPSNILMEADGQPRITDFGLAKRLTTEQRSLVTDHSAATAGSEQSPVISDSYSDLTVTGQVLGSPNYMPPEQASAGRGKAGRYSDVYSLGAVLYHLLTGRPPFLGETITATLHQVLEAEAASPRLLNPLVPVDLETICLKCLEKEPARRYATARELAEELGRFLKSEPILARPINRPQRFWRWCRRNPVVASLVSATVLLMLAVAIGSPVAVFRIEEQRKRAVQGEADAQRFLYIANLDLAQQAWEQNKLSRLERLLEESSGYAGKGFEWYFWKRQLHQRSRTLRGHLDEVSSVAVSPDGQRIASSSRDRTAKVWDLAGGREIMSLKGHSARIGTVCWFPDGRHLATASDDHTIKVWDALTGRELTTLKPRRGRIEAVAVSPEGRWLASANQDGTASLWEIPTSTKPNFAQVPTDPFGALREAKNLQGHTAGVLSVAFSADGQHLVTGSADNTARVWRITDSQSIQVLKGHADYVRGAVFSRDGRRIVTGSEDNTAMVWDVSNGRMLRKLIGHGTYIHAVAFSPDDQLIATASHDLTVKVWSADDGRERMTLDAHTQQVDSVAFSPDGRQLVTGGQDRLIKIWRLETSPDHLALQGHSQSVLSVAFSPDGKRLGSAGNDGSVRIWEAGSGREVQNLTGHRGAVFSVRFSPDGQHVVTAGNDATAKIWELASGKELFTFKRHGAYLLSADFSPDGRWIASSGADQAVYVWDAVNGQERFNLAASPKAHRDAVHQVAFDRDGRRMVTASWDRTAKIWDASTGRELLTLSGHQHWIHGAAFSPDGRWIATASGDQTAKIWDAASGREHRTLAGHLGNRVTCVAFTADSSRVVTGSWDGTAKIWDVVTGRQLLSLAVPARLVFSLATSPDGLRIALGSSEPGDQSASAFDPTSALSETATEDGFVTIWEAPSSEQLAGWVEDEKKDRDRMAAFELEFQDTARREKAMRLLDQGTVRHWLMLAPIPFSTNQTPADALAAQFVADEKSLQPKAGDRVRVGPAELEWLPIESPDPQIDFARTRYSELCVGYAVCYLESATEQTGIRILIGSDDLSKLYLNGEEVYESRFQRGLILDEDVAEGLLLKAGRNVLVFKVVNVRSHWLGSVRLTDAEGHPVKGIKASLAAPTGSRPSSR